MLADDRTVGQQDRAVRQRGCVAAQPARDHLRMIAVGDEADVLALDLLGDDLEAEGVRA